MSEIDRIVGQLDRAFSGEAWHGPSVMRLLSGVTATQASTRHIPDGHTIWELVQHIRAWKQEVTRRLDGLEARNLPAEENFPSAGVQDETTWQATIASLGVAHGELRDRVERLSEGRLDDCAGDADGTPWNVYETVHGSVQHDLYHAGQIALLRKA